MAQLAIAPTSRLLYARQRLQQELLLPGGREPGRTRQDAGVIAVDDVVDLVLRQQLLQELGRQVVGHICTVVQLR